MSKLIATVVLGSVAGLTLGIAHSGEREPEMSMYDWDEAELDYEFDEGEPTIPPTPAPDPKKYPQLKLYHPCMLAAWKAKIDGLPCTKYHVYEEGNTADPAVIAKYMAQSELKNSCYFTEATDTFVCYFKTPELACKGKVAIRNKVSPTQPSAMYNYIDIAPRPNGDWDCIVKIGVPGSDLSKVPLYYDYVSYQNAPRERIRMPDGTTMNGKPNLVKVSGPYRNVPDQPYTYGGLPFEGPRPGFGFSCTSEESIRDTLIDVNMKNTDKNGKHLGEIKSDLAGFEYPEPGGNYPCNEYKNNDPYSGTCVEPDTLFNNPAVYDPRNAQVNHIVPATDKRGCAWGDNSTKNAAIISAQLNVYLSNNPPPIKEIQMVNNAGPYIW